MNSNHSAFPIPHSAFSIPPCTGEARGVNRAQKILRICQGEIAVWRAARDSAVEVMLKCFAQNPGFYEVCEPTLQHGTPGASIVQMSCAVICHLLLQGTKDK